MTTRNLNTSNGHQELENRLHALTESLIQKQTTIESLHTERNSLTVQLERMEVLIFTCNCARIMVYLLWILFIFYLLQFKFIVDGPVSLKRNRYLNLSTNLNFNYLKSDVFKDYNNEHLLFLFWVLFCHFLVIAWTFGNTCLYVVFMYLHFASSIRWRFY